MAARTHFRGPDQAKYDNIMLTQFVQGYVKNVLDEDKVEIREAMLQYLSDLSARWRGGW